MILNTQPASSRHCHSQGVSLIEMMISLVIGMVVIGAIYPSYLSSNSGKNIHGALSQMSEDATLAMNLIRKQVSLAGYSRAVGYNSSGLFNRAYRGQAIAGCDKALFDNPTAATIAELQCTGNTSASDNAMAVAYEADRDNALFTTNNLPRDCVATGIQASTTPTGEPYFLAESRLYISNNSLMCKGNGQAVLPVTGVPLTASAQPLVNNIVSMRIRYGIANDTLISGLDGSQVSKAGPTPSRFLTAAAIQALGPATWNNVKAIRICLLVRSAQEVLDQPTPYYDCSAIEDASNQPKPTTPTDRRMYRAFSTTIMIKNRLGGT